MTDEALRLNITAQSFYTSTTQWPKSVDESDFVGTACNSCFSDQNL